MGSDSKEYELLTQRVFQAMLDQHTVTNLKVEHNILLTGISGVPRQIDVYWEFEMAGVVHRAIVECKAWSYPVKLGTLDALQGMLTDFPGHLGAIVAKSGFQEGCQDKAAKF